MLTNYLARVIGLWLVLTVVGMILTPQTTTATINALFASSPVLWVTGVFTMLVGLIIVVVHNRWSGGALPVIVTLYGWIALAKGLTFVWLPPAVQTALWQSLHFERFYYGYLAVSLIIGAYLTYGGFKFRDLSTGVDLSAPSGGGAPVKHVTPTTWPAVPKAAAPKKAPPP